MPALTAEQVLTEALASSPGMTLLVHGAGGVTGGLIVQLAAFRGLDVIATAGASGRARVRQLGAREVVDRNDPDWTQQVRQIAPNKAVTAAVNAVRDGASTAMTVLADGGQLVTITSDPPPEERDIPVSNYYLRAPGWSAARRTGSAARGRKAQPVGARRRAPRRCRPSTGERGRRFRPGSRRYQASIVAVTVGRPRGARRTPGAEPVR